MTDLDLDTIEAQWYHRASRLIAESHVPALVFEVRRLYRKRDEAVAAITRVRALHAPEWVVIDHVGGSVCRECREPVESEPCATIRALDGAS